MDVAQLFRTARERKGLSQQALAALTGLSWSTVSRTECGRLLPTGLSLFTMADTLEVPYEELRLAVYESAGVTAPDHIESLTA